MELRSIGVSQRKKIWRKLRLRLQNRIKFNHSNARSGTWKLHKFLLKTGSSSDGNGVTGKRLRYPYLSEDDNMLLLLQCGPARKANTNRGCIRSSNAMRWGPGETTSTHSSGCCVSRNAKTETDTKKDNQQCYGMGDSLGSRGKYNLSSLVNKG